jgi:hypothetical protein
MKYYTLNRCPFSVLWQLSFEEELAGQPAHTAGGAGMARLHSVMGLSTAANYEYK